MVLSYSDNNSSNFFLFQNKPIVQNAGYFHTEVDLTSLQDVYRVAKGELMLLLSQRKPAAIYTQISVQYPNSRMRFKYLCTTRSNQTPVIRNQKLLVIF